MSSTAGGGNPAGVWAGDALASPDDMLRIAAELGYAETAFIARGGRERTIRYYSPEAEVSSCGHATIATGGVLGEIEGDGGIVVFWGEYRSRNRQVKSADANLHIHCRRRP